MAAIAAARTAGGGGFDLAAEATQVFDGTDEVPRHKLVRVRRHKCLGSV